MQRKSCFMRQWAGLLAVALLVCLSSASPALARRTFNHPTANVSDSFGGPFTLTDQRGRTVTDKSWPGKYLLVTFGFTFCPDICPTQLQTAINALDLIGPQLANKVQPLFITVDPSRDSPEALADYVQQFSDSLVGLTGDPDQIATVTKAYGVSCARVPNPDKDDDTGAEYQMDYTATIFLVAPNGQPLRAFPAGTTVDDLAKGLRTSLN